MKNTPLKSRFCPSPTGMMHLGNTRTALFNALLARHADGIFLLRIEDTDKLRSEERYTDVLMADLLWLGLPWQEGPEHDLGAGPYWQSQRQAIYDRYYREMEQSGLAYPCFCSEQQLNLHRKIQRAAGKPPRYPGTCRQLSPAQIQEKIDQGLQPALRFAVPEHAEVVFTDLVRGEQRFSTDDLGDFIVRRADGTPPFMFCNAIDDALMGVTHALRGEDHLTNTPRQILILQALKLPIANYGHITLIVGPDGSPLSKRHGSRSVNELREEGFLPIAIVNYLARLGHYYEDDSFMSLQQLAAKFSLNNLGKSPARFDATQLLRWQKEAVSRLTPEQLWNWLGANVQALIPIEKRDLFIAAVQPNIAFPNDAIVWATIFFGDELTPSAEARTILADTPKAFFEVAADALNNTGADFAALSKVLKEKLNVSGKNLFQPLRAVLTGELHGPEMAKIFELLGEKKIRQRFKNQLDHLGSKGKNQAVG